MPDLRRSLPVIALAALVGLVGVVVTTALRGGDDNTTAPAVSLPPPTERGATTSGTAAAVPETSIVATAAKARVDVFEAAGGTTPKLSLDNPVATGGPLVLLVEQTQNDWLRVLLPVRPNGSTGWIRKADVTLSQHNFHIEVHLSDFRLDLYQGRSVVYSASVGVARDNAPTPGGRYYTTELLKPPANSPYGTFAYGLSGFSNTFETFEGGPGQLGIHGTNDPTTIGTKVSSGCVRMRNADIERLAAMLPLGVPVVIDA